MAAPLLFIEIDRSDMLGFCHVWVKLFIRGASWHRLECDHASEIQLPASYLRAV